MNYTESSVTGKERAESAPFLLFQMLMDILNYQDEHSCKEQTGKIAGHINAYIMERAITAGDEVLDGFVHAWNKKPEGKQRDVFLLFHGEMDGGQYKYGKQEVFRKVGQLSNIVVKQVKGNGEAGSVDIFQ